MFKSGYMLFEITSGRMVSPTPVDSIKKTPDGPEDFSCLKSGAGVGRHPAASHDGAFGVRGKDPCQWIID